MVCRLEEPIRTKKFKGKLGLPDVGKGPRSKKRRMKKSGLTVVNHEKEGRCDQERGGGGSVMVSREARCEGGEKPTLSLTARHKK